MPSQLLPCSRLAESTYVASLGRWLVLCLPLPLFKTQLQGFPGGPVVKKPPSNAGDLGSIPGREIKIPHAAEQLSPHAPTKEPADLN